MIEISKCDARPPVIASNAQRFRDVVGEAWSAYLSAAEQVGEIGIDVDIAGSCVRLRFAGSALVEPIMTALDHRRIPQHGHPDITIGLFDFHSTGLQPAVVDLLGKRAPADGAIWRWSEHGSHLLYQRGPAPTVQTFDAAHQRALFWISDACELPAWGSLQAAFAGATLVIGAWTLAADPCWCSVRRAWWRPARRQGWRR